MATSSERDTLTCVRLVARSLLLRGAALHGSVTQSIILRQRAFRKKKKEKRDGHMSMNVDEISSIASLLVLTTPAMKTLVHRPRK